MSKYWIKLYHEVLDDPKMGRLQDNLYRRCIELFLLAGETDNGGELPPIDDMAWRLRLDPDMLTEELIEIERTTRIVRRIDGGWVVTKFAERQDADTGSERVNRYRETKRKELQAVTNSYKPVTNRVTNAVRDIDIDIDKDNYEERAALPPAQIASEVYGPTDSFDAMKGAIESLIGYMIPPVPSEVEAINAMVAEGIGSDDLNSAVAFHREKGIVVRGAASLLKSARFNKAQRTQANVKAPPRSNGRRGPNPNVFEQARKELAEREQ